MPEFRLAEHMLTYVVKGKAHTNLYARFSCSNLVSSIPLPTAFLPYPLSVQLVDLVDHAGLYLCRSLFPTLAQALPTKLSMPNSLCQRLNWHQLGIREKAQWRNVGLSLEQRWLWLGRLSRLFLLL